MNDLWTVLSEVTDISAKLSSKDTLGLEEVDEVRLLPAAQIVLLIIPCQIAQSSGVRYTEDLDMMQRRLLAHKELEKARETRVDVVLRRLRESSSFDVNLVIVKAFLIEHCRFTRSYIIACLATCGLLLGALRAVTAKVKWSIACLIRAPRRQLLKAFSFGRG